MLRPSLLTLLLLASGCGTATYSPSVCPEFPKGGAVVGAELDRVCPGSTCPAIDAWLTRLDVLKRQLDVCRAG